MRFSFSVMFLLALSSFDIQAQGIDIKWEPREDLNILLPNSIKIYDTYGKLADGEPVRATYAEVDLRDENLKLRAHGSHKKRQTTRYSNIGVNINAEVKKFPVMEIIMI